jgi:adenine-specific DNA methylase
MLLFFVEQAIWGMSVLARYTPTHYSQVNQYLTGVYYVASQIVDVSPWYILAGKLSRLSSAFASPVSVPGAAVITTGTCAALPMPADSVDYVFTDPPFGANIFYADLNFLVEAWHRVRTDAEPEAIKDEQKRKGLHEYHDLMTQCFAEYCRVLKPGRWMTVVFHNSSNAVWNAIQEAMLAGGFVVADVRTLDKQQGSYRQVTSTAVKQDLVISAYRGLMAATK